MRAALAVAAAVLAGCPFEHGERPHDAAPRDGTGSDVDADTPRDARQVDAAIDARACPAAPPDCELFTCSSSTSCYYVCGNSTPGSKKSWPAARAACTEIGAGACIATIDDQDEQDCILHKARPSFPMSNWIWFGYRQPPGTGEPLDGWAWECSTSTFTQAPWGSGAVGGEPSQTGEEDCAAMTTDGGWFDASCNDSARYLCELP
jgi:hypothetical protein